VIAAVLVAAPALVQASIHTPNAPATEEQLRNRVRHELLMLPYYNLFDNLSFKIEGNNVILYGQVTPWTDLKGDAARVVKSIPGIGTVTNNIEVLPLSPFDRQIRIAEARAIFSQASLSKYAMVPLPPIHIIVKNGNVTLVGVVDNQTDKNIAGIRANGVPNVFSVKNDLEVRKNS
jgi:hyperosmotically inducible protein